MNKLYFLAITVLLVACGPKQPSVAERRAEKAHRDSVEWAQHERTLVYCDSMLAVLIPAVDEQMKAFRYVKDERYEDHGHYVHRLLDTGRNSERCFLQPYVSDDYHITLRSYFFGERKIKHQFVVIKADSLEYRATGTNHDFETLTAEEDDHFRYHEVLTLTEEDCAQVLSFVDAYRDSRLKVVLEGKGRYVYYLDKQDREALLDTYQLGVLMRDIHQLELQRRQASLQVEKFQKRYAK